MFYTNHNVVHVHVVHICIVHVVLVVVNNLIRAHYNIIMKATVASGGRLPIPSWLPDVPLGAMVWCGHHDE